MSSDPHYAQAAATLRRRILQGELLPGQQLASERELCAELGVSRITVRRALSILAEERLIHRQQGSGTFVSPKPSRRIPLMIDYTGSMQAHAPLMTRRVRTWRWQQAPEWVAEELQLSPSDEILYAERVDEVEEASVAWDQAYIVRSYGQKLTEADLRRIDFVETWARQGDFTMEACRQTIDARAATVADVEALGVARGRSLLVSQELYLASGNRPAGLYVSRYNPAYISFQSTYRWDAVKPHPAKKGA